VSVTAPVVPTLKEREFADDFGLEIGAGCPRTM
jgi:hypothetical protein